MPSRDKRLTVSPSVDRKEYNRQYHYIQRHPDCKFVPPDPRKDGRRLYKKKDPRITACLSVDRKEYNRQKKYVSTHPDCVSVPPRNKPCKLPTHLISVKAGEDRNSYDRQYGWLQRHPEATSIPQHIINGPIYKRKRDYRLNLLKSRVMKKPVFVTKTELSCGEYDFIDGDDV